MKIIVLKKNLKDGLVAVERAIAENNNLPILKYVLLNTSEGKIRLVTTNLELAVTTLVSGKIIEDGGIAVPFSTFSSVISGADNERIDIEVKNNNLHIKTDNYEAKIQGIQKEDFPIIPKLENSERYIEIDSSVLKESLNQVSNAAQISEIRPELSGVLFDLNPSAAGVLKLAATDSFRLSEKTILNKQIKTNIENPLKIIVPLKTIQEISRIFSEDGFIKILCDANQILVRNDKTEIISRLIDGGYPDYEQIVPKSSEVEVTVPRDGFLNALKLVSNFSGKVNDIRLRLKNEGKALELYSANQNLGENNYLIAVNSNNTKEIDVAFNWRYLHDGVKVSNSKEFIFSLNGEVKPAVMRPTDDASYFYLVMPIRNT